MTKKMLNSKPFKKQTLAEQVADIIEESIVSGVLQGGDSLPTEPEISEQFGVSRAVVRDATRMLAAKGLVEARHGKGVFVTHTQVDAFGDALLLALRRMGATNWDVAQFEQMLYPEIMALAAANATEADIAHIEQAVTDYLALHATLVDGDISDEDSAEVQQFRRLWAVFNQTLFDATHNKVVMLLAQPLVQLHAPRDWIGLQGDVIQYEAELLHKFSAMIAAGDPDAAREQTHALMALPPEGVAAMQQAAVGTVTTIVLESDD